MSYELDDECRTTYDQRKSGHVKHCMPEQKHGIDIVLGWRIEAMVSW